MSGNCEALAFKKEDAVKMLQATVHLGSTIVNHQMDQYIYKRRPDGVNILNLRKTWEKLILAVRAIVAIEHPSDIFVVSGRAAGQRAVLKFSSYTGATPIAGRYTPGAFTNQIQAAFREPRLLIVTDPIVDHQAVTEASYVNIPVIALCNLDTPVRYVDIAIPCNIQADNSIGLIYWFLAREVLKMRGTEKKWDVMVDLFFQYKEAEGEEAEKPKDSFPAAKEYTAIDSAPAAVMEDWGADDPIVVPTVASENWADQVSAAAPEAQAAPAAFGTNNDWGAAPQQDDWAASAPVTMQETAPAPVAQSDNWGGGSTQWT